MDPEMHGTPASKAVLRKWNGTWLLVALVALTFLSRLLFVSSPYFIDGPRLVRAISSGPLFIQTPGYFLFILSGRLVFLTGLLSASASATFLNVVFSTLGVGIFAVVCARLLPGRIGVLVAVFYGFCDTVWFTADVQSSYASMTFFAPAILYFLLVRESWWMVGLLWACMTGFRPSDGTFVLPCLLMLLASKGWRERREFALAALPICLLWYVPTVHHFGGNILSPLSSSGDLAHQLANGLIVPGVSAERKLANLVHVTLGAFNAWGILLPFVLEGLVRKSIVRRLALWWCLPGVAFFVLFFFSDSVYLSYLIAPGLLAAGFALRRLTVSRSTLILGCAIALSVLQMAVLRPIRSDTTAKAVLDAYTLQYSGWALRHSDQIRLRDQLSAK